MDSGYGWLCLIIALTPFWIPLAVYFGLRPLLRWHDARRSGQQSRGFEVKLNTGETPVPQSDTNRGPVARAERKDDHG